MRLSVHLLIALLLAATDASAQPSFSAPLELAAGTDPAAVATADLTGDSNLDLVVVSRTSDDAHVYVGDGNGGFVFLQSFSVGNFPQGVGAADLDGDTRQDLVTTAVPFNTGTTTPWLGIGDGTFVSGSVLTADDGTRAVAIVDIDDDGRLDIVVTNPTRDNISVFLGDGDGTFGSEIRTSVGPSVSFPTDLAVADFDEDGNLDVVTSNAQSVDDSLALLRGDGDGTFQASTAFATTCDRPESVVAGDFDGDENVDVAAACFFSGDVVVMLGNGNGTFDSPVLYELSNSASPYWILRGDFDNDGIDDLVTSNNGSFSVLPGNGDGTFDDEIDTVAVGTFFGAVAGDYDEDGRLDLAFANPGQNELWIYLNTTASPVPLFHPVAAWLLASTFCAIGIRRATRPGR